MKISKFSSILLFVLTMILLVGCSGEKEVVSDTNSPDEGKKSESVAKKLNVAFHDEPPTFDTHISSSQAAADIAGNFFETLVTTDLEGNIQPMLADSWELSEDGKTFTFHLRQGVLFHNGDEMVADDVVASMNRWIEISNYGKTQFAGSIFEKVDDYTVKLIRQEPSATALTQLAFGAGHFPAIMPKKVIDSADKTGITEYIGTGPFKIKEHKQGQYIHLTKFEEYKPRSEKSNGAAGARNALVDDVFIHFVSDPSTRVAGSLSGEYDIAIRIPTDNVGPLENKSDINLHVKPSGNLEMYFNKKKGLFTDKNARHAVAAGLNMSEIMNNALTSEDYYDLTHNIMLKSQENKWNSDIGKDLYNVHDIEKAKELLAKTDYNGEEITILTMRSLDLMYKATVVIQQQLQQMGINAKLETMDRATYDERRRDENGFDIFLVTNIPRPEPTSSPFFNRADIGFTDDVRIDELLAEFRGQKSIEDALPIYQDLQKWFWDYLPIVKIGDMKIINVTNKKVKNFQYNDSMILYNVEVSD